MPLDTAHPPLSLRGHALRNAHLRQRALVRAQNAPPLARLLVRIRADTLGLTRLEFARRSGIGRGTLRDLELGVHRPTRRTLQHFVAFCQRCGVSAEQLEEVRQLYTGSGDTLQQLLARLELRAGSARELAKRVGISPATLWEYRRGNFPLPLALLHRLCAAAGEEVEDAEALWQESERRRLRERGYPQALAEFWALCSREGYVERHLLTLGVSTSTVRRLRYLELPPWSEVADVARTLCRHEQEFEALHQLWLHDQNEQTEQLRCGFGSRLQQLRKQQGITRRQLADLFGVGGKKPARIIKYIEEDGFYSAQAYPAGLAAVLAHGTEEEARLLELWEERRRQFHRRRRPETRTELRLARERYGFELRDMEPILGYSSLEYQRIERGVGRLSDTARARILEAIHRAGRCRVEAVLQQRVARQQAQLAWQAPPSLTAMLHSLVEREGGIIPLARRLRQAGVKGLWSGRLRALLQGKEVPAWYTLQQIGQACEVTDLREVHAEWSERYRTHLLAQGCSPLGVELRVVMAEVAATVRAFSPRLGFNYSVLIRDLQRIDRHEPVRWRHVERILQAAGLNEEDSRWQAVYAWWYSSALQTEKPRRRRRPAEAC